jgi:hypothetical protein
MDAYMRLPKAVGVDYGCPRAFGDCFHRIRDNESYQRFGWTQVYSHLLATAVNKILFASATLRFTESRFSQRSDSCDRCSDAACTKKEIGLKSLYCADKKLAVRDSSLI